ncbi:hypothetical protein MKL09_31480, partial [Methylobacterium sp. J-048]|uniref:acyl-CoA dehydrogenase family protein n=1 Tax=Methylobacterium sp. J-048 TaxID=2836635 RepID=UPI0024452E5A
ARTGHELVGITQGLAQLVEPGAGRANRVRAERVAAGQAAHEVVDRALGQTGGRIAAANVYAGTIALEVTSQIFEVMGARSATNANGFDRFWRNVRIHTL